MVLSSAASASPRLRGSALPRSACAKSQAFIQLTAKTKPSLGATREPWNSTFKNAKEGLQIQTMCFAGSDSTPRNRSLLPKFTSIPAKTQSFYRFSINRANSRAQFHSFTVSVWMRGFGCKPLIPDSFRVSQFHNSFFGKGIGRSRQ